MIVTGAGGGIGGATARRFAEEGASVAVLNDDSNQQAYIGDGANILSAASVSVSGRCLAGFGPLTRAAGLSSRQPSSNPKR